MVFASVEFLFVFLPLTIALYLLAAFWTRSLTLPNIILLLASLFFYFWDGGSFILVLIGVLIFNFAAGLLIAAYRDANRALAKATLAAGVAVNLGILAYYKYAGFIAVQTTYLPDWMPKLDPEIYKMALPIGISFYIFQAISYLVDIYRGDITAQTSLTKFALFKAMFPQLIAGPIVRYSEVGSQLSDRPLVPSSDDFAEGITRFCIGFAKKVIVADTMAVVADAVYGVPGGSMSAPAAWLGVIAYTFQIYFDFSAYSDMAIGLSRMFGFRFPENFDRPYASSSVTEFWRRWHMTLSRWFRDYLYIPLGGSRGTPLQTYTNLSIVFLATGIWHGANWTFILWGVYHGAWLIIERLLGIRTETEGTPRLWRRLTTFLIVALGWNLFRATDITHALQIYASMFAGGFGGLPSSVSMHTTNYFVFIFLLATGHIIASQYGSVREFVMGKGRLADAARLAVVGGAFPYAVMMILSGTFSAFIYYQF